MDRPEIILAPGPTPIPPEVLLAQGSPLVYHRGPGFGKLMRDVTGRLRELYRTDAADVLLMTSSRHRRARVRDPELLLARRRGARADRRASSPIGCKRLAESFGLTVRTVDYEWGERVRPDDVAAALAEHPVKAVLLTQSETSTGVIQPIEQLARVANDAGAHGGRRRRLVARRRAVRVRRLGHRRRGRRVAEGALAPRPASRSSRSATGRGRRRATATCPRFYFDWATYRRFADLPAPGEPVDPGDQRDAGAAGRARAVLPGRRRGRDAPPPDAVARGEGGRRRRSASTCSARGSTTTGPSRRSARPRSPTPTRSATRSARTTAASSRRGRVR